MKQTPASVRLIDRAGHSAMSCRLHSSELFFGAQSFATASVPSSQCSARGCQSCSLGDDPIWCTHLDRRWSPVIECQCEKSFTAHILPPRPECSSYSSCSLCSISARRPNTVPPSPLAASALLSGAVVGKVSPTSTAALASKMRYRVCEIAALLQRAAGRHSCPGSRSLSGPLLVPASLSRGYLQTPRCRFPDPPPSCFSTAHPPGGRNPVTPVCDSPLLLPAVDQSYLSELLGAIIPHAKCETANGRSVTMDHSSLQSRCRLRSLLFRSSISCV